MTCPACAAPPCEYVRRSKESQISCPLEAVVRAAKEVDVEYEDSGDRSDLMDDRPLNALRAALARLEESRRGCFCPTLPDPGPPERDCPIHGEVRP